MKKILKCPKCKTFDVNIREFCTFSKSFDASINYEQFLGERVEGITHQNGECNSCSHIWKLRKMIDLPLDKIKIIVQNMKYICQNCKEEKLKQIGVKMSIGIGWCAIGNCDICNKSNQELFTYKEQPKDTEK